jgi:hypothetical protein
MSARYTPHSGGKTLSVRSSGGVSLAVECDSAGGEFCPSAGIPHSNITTNNAAVLTGVSSRFCLLRWSRINLAHSIGFGFSFLAVDPDAPFELYLIA